MKPKQESLACEILTALNLLSNRVSKGNQHVSSIDHKQTLHNKTALHKMTIMIVSKLTSIKKSSVGQGNSLIITKL